MDDDSLLVRQADLRRDAATFVRELELIDVLGREDDALRIETMRRVVELDRGIDLGL